MAFQDAPPGAMLWLGKDIDGNDCVFSEASLVPKEFMQIALQACNTTFWRGCSAWLEAELVVGWKQSVVLPSEAGEHAGLRASSEASNHYKRVRCIGLSLIVNAALQGSIDTSTLKGWNNHFPDLIENVRNFQPEVRIQDEQQPPRHILSASACRVKEEQHSSSSGERDSERERSRSRSPLFGARERIDRDRGDCRGMGRSDRGRTIDSIRAELAVADAKKEILRAQLESERQRSHRIEDLQVALSEERRRCERLCAHVDAANKRTEAANRLVRKLLENNSALQRKLDDVVEMATPTTTATAPPT